MTYMDGLLFGAIVTMFIMIYKDIYDLENRLNKYEERLNNYEEKLKTLFYHLKDKN